MDKHWTDGAATDREMAKKVIFSISSQISILSRFDYLKGQS